MVRKTTTAFTDRVLSWAVRQQLGRFTRYLVSTLILLAVAIVRMLYITALLPWLPFIPVVTLLSLFMGARFGFRLDHEFANALNTFAGAMIALRLGAGIA